MVREARPSVLVADPDAEVRRYLATLYERAGWNTAIALRGRDAMRLLFERRPDLVVLDLAVDEGGGWDTLAQIRDVSEVPLLILSRDDHEVDKVRALRGGADDYMTKPFGSQELVARSDALLRRAARTAPAGDVYDDGRIAIYFAQRRVTADGVDVALTPLEYRLLATFVGHPKQVLSWTQLIEIVWRSGVGSRDQVKVYVGYLRRKLGNAGTLIRTVRGFGYRYDPAPGRREPPPRGDGT